MVGCDWMIRLTGDASDDSSLDSGSWNGRDRSGPLKLISPKVPYWTNEANIWCRWRLERVEECTGGVQVMILCDWRLLFRPRRNDVV